MVPAGNRRQGAMASWSRPAGKGGNTMWQTLPRHTYRRCVWDCSEWLAQYCVPWRWVVTFHETVRALRHLPL